MTGGPHARDTVRDEAPKPGELEYLEPPRRAVGRVTVEPLKYQRAASPWRHEHTSTLWDGRRITWTSLPVQGRRRGR